MNWETWKTFCCEHILLITLNKNRNNSLSNILVSVIVNITYFKAFNCETVDSENTLLLFHTNNCLFRVFTVLRRLPVLHGVGRRQACCWQATAGGGDSDACRPGESLSVAFWRAGVQEEHVWRGKRVPAENHPVDIRTDIQRDTWQQEVNLSL